VIRGERHQLVAELMREDWAEVPLDFEWTPATVAEVERLHAAGDDHALSDPSMHVAAFGLDLLARAGEAVDERAEEALVAEVLRPWLEEPPATPELVAEVRRRWRAEGDRVVTADATRGYALFGLRLLSRARGGS
jgi:hypothetical protein